MIVLVAVGIRLFVTRVVNSIGHCTFNRLRQDLLDLLGNDGSLAIILRMRLGSGLISLAAGGVNLETLLVLSMYFKG